MRKYQILVIHSYTIDLNKILTIEFFTNDKTHLRWWLDALVYVLLHSVGSSTDLLHADFELNWCCWRGFAKFAGVLIVSKLFLIGSGFLPDEYLLPPAMFL